MRFAVLVLTLALLGGCASTERAHMTRFDLIRTDADASYFRFKAPAAGAVSYSLDDKGDEAVRMQWIQDWLDVNGLQGKRFEIVSRMQAVPPSENSRGSDIYYEIKVPR